MRRSELFLAVYLPTALLAMGQGLLLATLPFYATELGVSLTMVSVISSAAAIGTLVSDLPAGAVLFRIGLRRSMLIGSALVVIGTISLAMPLTTEAVVGFRLLAGVGTAMWGLSRHAFITQNADVANRGKSIAMFGGINRIGMFAGPAIGGIVATASSTGTSFLVAGVMGALAFVAAVAFIPDDRESVIERRGMGRKRWDVVFETLRKHSGDMTAAAVAQLFAQMIRQGRQLLIPLVGAVTLGLNPAEVGVIMTLSAVLDMTMFIPAGILMDRYGRKFASVPSFAIMAIGIGIVPLANDFTGLLIAGLIGDTGMVAGPLTVGLIATGVGLAGSAYVLMAAGLLASAILYFLVNETRVDPVVHSVKGLETPGD
jgi:MFS family permease